jgi:DNA-binding winged helix-turn-helix (wHTH) protein
MKFSFKYFQFNVEKQILTKDGVIISLNEKPAQLLTVLLLDANKIHSKTDILETVWPDRVVTDQVVFQNISLLRTLFGNDAIKTFSKKGYQWQLPLTVVSEKLTNLNENSINNALHIQSGIEKECDIVEEILTTSSNNKLATSHLDSKPSNSERTPTNNKHLRKTTRFNDKKSLKPVIAFLLLVSFFLVMLWLNILDENKITNKPSNRYTVVSLLPVINSQLNEVTKKVSAILLNSNNISLSTQNQFTGQQLFNSPFQTWIEINKSDQHLLLSFKLYPLSGEVTGDIALRFYLQGKHRGWQGYIVGKSEFSLAEQLTQIIASVQASAYFSLTSTNAALAQFTLLHNDFPNSPVFIQQLIQLHFELGNFDIAQALVERELKKPQHLLYLGLYHFLKTKIYDLDKDRLIIRTHVEHAIDIFAQINTPQLESRTLIPRAWLAYLDGDKNQSFEYLNASANRARIANEPLLEVEAHLTQSYMASKIGQIALMHSQMNFAKQLITLHNLGNEHQIPVLTNLAWSSKLSSDKAGYFQKVLDMPFSPLYRQNFYYADQYVKEGLLKKKKFEQVLASIKTWQRTSYTMLTRAQVAFAQQQWQQAGVLAQQAFTTARITNETADALDAALLLIQHQQQLSNDYNVAEHFDYISQNPSVSWRRVNQSLLKELGLW